MASIRKQKKRMIFHLLFCQIIYLTLFMGAVNHRKDVSGLLTRGMTMEMKILSDSGYDSHSQLQPLHPLPLSLAANVGGCGWGKKHQDALILRAQ